jgi:CheY-like chemotaxis protein
MDYSRLSRESLIHEIKQLNLENERIRLKSIGNQFKVQDCLNDIHAPAFIVNTEFKVLWANSHSSDVHFELLEKKCYQIFFGFEEPCPGCLMQTCATSLKERDMFVNGTSVHFIPIIREDKLQGVLEIQYISEDAKRSGVDLLAKIEALEERLEINRSKYENLNQLMMNFSKAMRVPLRSFIGFFQVLNENDNEALKKQYLDILKMNSEVLYESLNKVLLFSKFENGVLSGKKEPFIIRSLIEETLAQVVLPSDTKSLPEYKLFITESLPDILIGDAFRFKLLVAYLIEFSQHISNRKFIEIKVSDISQTHSKVVLKISIQTSILIEKKQKNMDYFDVHLNNQFESIEEYSLGLGLNLAKKIVEDLNGTLEMSSGLDDTFYIDMTLNYDKVIPRTEEDVKIYQHKKKLLIADFEKPMLSLELFKNYDVYFAHSGDEAINQYFTIEPDLTIINVLIENCDGFKVFDEIERRRKRNTPIVAISNKLVDNEREFLRDYGFDEYYPKPLSDEKLQNIVDNYF